MKITYICTSNRDRSVALEKYFREFYPKHEYRSAGINQYHCTRKGTHLVTEEDIIWSDLIVFAEDVHALKINNRFKCLVDMKNTTLILESNQKPYPFITLNLGEYERGDVNLEYLTKAEEKLKSILS